MFLFTVIYTILLLHTTFDDSKQRIILKSTKTCISIERTRNHISFLYHYGNDNDIDDDTDYRR